MDFWQKMCYNNNMSAVKRTSGSTKTGRTPSPSGKNDGYAPIDPVGKTPSIHGGTGSGTHAGVTFEGTFTTLTNDDDHQSFQQPRGQGGGSPKEKKGENKSELQRFIGEGGHLFGATAGTVDYTALGFVPG